MVFCDDFLHFLKIKINKNWIHQTYLVALSIKHVLWLSTIYKNRLKEVHKIYLVFNIYQVKLKADIMIFVYT